MLTNVNNLPQPLVDAVTKEYEYKDKQYSVTSLLKGTCQILLERRHDKEIVQDVSDMVWLLFGNAVHKVLEEAKETDDQLKENYIVIDVGDGYKLSGIFDLYDAKEKEVTDYKTASVWKVQYNDWDDYHKQTLMYGYMLRAIGFECEKGKIVAFLKDHSKTKASVDSDYPQLPVYVKKFEFTEKDNEDIKQFIINKFEEIKNCEKLSDEELPPCSPKERWHKDDTYAVMKEGRKTAIKVCQSEEEAQQYIANNELDSKHYIEFREGKDGRCDEYCNVKQWCPFYQMKNKKVE